jgi:protein subunit release factor B
MKTSLIVEVRSGEGGDDAKELLQIHTALYVRFALRRGL